MATCQAPAGCRPSLHALRPAHACRRSRLRTSGVSAAPGPRRGRLAGTGKSPALQGQQQHQRLPALALAAVPAANAAVVAAAAAATAAATAPVTFEPRLDAGVLATQAVVLALCASAAAYWWLVVVPSERAALARSKRRGEVGSYLEGLEQAGQAKERGLERWFYTEWLQTRQKKRQQAAGGSTGTQAEAGEAGGSKPAEGTTAQPSDNLLRPTVETPTPAFLSLDNPIVATAALIALAGGVSVAWGLLTGGHT